MIMTFFALPAELPDVPDDSFAALPVSMAGATHAVKSADMRMINRNNAAVFPGDMVFRYI
jgi:hypothetical protein